MSADLLRGIGSSRVRAPSSAPLSGHQSSNSSDSGSSVSTTSSTGSHRNKQLLKTYHDFAMQIFNPGHAQDVENLFLSAARDGDFARVENFLRRRNHELVNIDVKDKCTGNTPILWAAKNGHLKIVQLLLKYGADITIRNFDNETAVEAATPGICTALLQSVDRNGCSPRHLLQAAWQGNIKVVQRLLNESKVLDINCRNADGFTPLLLVTRDVDLFEQIGSALENYSPQAVVKELLLHRADLTTPDAEGRTPLHFTASSKAKVSEEIAAILMSKPIVLEMKDRRSLAPIHSASQSGQVEILLALLDNGVNVNARGYAGATPLHVSAYSGQLQAATKLLDHGADVTLVDDSGNTPVDVAKTKKLKLALREAWTEATQAKRDVVLTPVKPPSRMAESRGPSTEDRSTHDSMGATPRPGSSINSTPEKRIIRKMTEAHKAVLAEEQMLRDIESGRFTPSSMPRKLGLPRASSRNGTSSVKLPVPPKTPRVLDHSSCVSPGSTPEKAKKPATRSLFGGRPRTNTVPGSERTTEMRNQRVRAHAKLTQRNSEPVSKVTADVSQIPVTVVGLDLDDNLRDMRFQRLVSGPINPYLERLRSHERVDASVNSTPPIDRRSSAGRRGSNPSVHDLTGACIDYLRKGRKSQRPLSNFSISMSGEDESCTSAPKRPPVRANMQTHPLNLEQMHLRLSTPSPMLDPTQLFNPTSRHVIPLSPSQYSENIQETIFEFEDEEEEQEDLQSRSLCKSLYNLNGHFTLSRTKSILDPLKPFSIESTRIHPQKEVSTDSGQGSNSISSSSASTFSTPSPLMHFDADSHLVKNPVKNRLGVKMTPSATTVKEHTKISRTLNFAAWSALDKDAVSTKTIPTSATTEISLRLAKNLVEPNSDVGEVPSKIQQLQASTSEGKQQTAVEVSRRKTALRNSVPNSENKTVKTEGNSFSVASVLGKKESVEKTKTKNNSENTTVAMQPEEELTKTQIKIHSSRASSVKKGNVGEMTHETAVDSQAEKCTKFAAKKTEIKIHLSRDISVKEVIVEKAVGGMKHETAVDSQAEKGTKFDAMNKLKHETVVDSNQSGKQPKSAGKPVLGQTDKDSKPIQGSNSVRLSSKSLLSSGGSNSSSRKTSREEQAASQKVENTISQIKLRNSTENRRSVGDKTNSAVNQCKSEGTKLMFGRLSGQNSPKKKVDAKSVPGGEKSITGPGALRTSVEAPKKASYTSQESSVKKTGAVSVQGSQQGKLLAPSKRPVVKADTPSHKMDSLTASCDMPKVSPRPGHNQDSKSPSGSTEKASPRIQASKGEPSLSKSFGSGSSLVKTELRNMVNGSKQTPMTKKIDSSDEGVGLELEELIDKINTSNEIFQGKQIISDSKQDKTFVTLKTSPVIDLGKTKIKNTKPDTRSKSSVPDTKVANNLPRDKTFSKGQKASKKAADIESIQSDLAESVEDVYEEVAFVSDEEKGENEGVKTTLPQDAVKIQIKEVNISEEKKSKLKKVVGKPPGRIVPAGKTQPWKQTRDTGNKVKEELPQSALKAVGKSVSESRSNEQRQKPVDELPKVQPLEKQKKILTEESGMKDGSEKMKESLSPKSPHLPNQKTSKFHWSKFKSPEISPRSDSSFEVPHDPRIIKEHTPVITDVMEFINLIQLQKEPTPIPWKPREKITSTSSCPNYNTHVKTRRRIASIKETPKKSPVKGSLRKIAIMGQSSSKGKGKVIRPGSGGKSRQKKKRESDAIALLKKGKARIGLKTKAENSLKQGKLHLLSESDSNTKAFITGQGWHIQTKKNETSDIIVHDRSAFDSSSDSSMESDSASTVNNSVQLSPHNTLMLNELCKLHPLSPNAINNIANIMSPLEVDTPHYIPDTMGAIKQFGDSLKSDTSSENDKNKANVQKTFSFEKEIVDSLENGISWEEPVGSREIVEQKTPSATNAGSPNHSKDLSTPFKPEGITVDDDINSASEISGNHESCSKKGVVDQNYESTTTTPRIITSGISGNMTDRSDASYGAGEDMSSYETNPEFLKVFRLQDHSTPRASPTSLMHNDEIGSEKKSANMEEVLNASDVCHSSHLHEAIPTNKDDIKDCLSEEKDTLPKPTSGKIAQKPPLPSNITISELTRVPRGSIKRRHSEPPAKMKEKSKGVEEEEDVADVRRVIKVKNSWKEEKEDADLFLEEDHSVRFRPKWREQSNKVEDMISPLKSRLPDKNFSPPSSSQESPTRRRGNSMPDVMNQNHCADENSRNKRRTSEVSQPLPSQRKHSNCSDGSEVFLNDCLDDDDDEEDETVRDKVQRLTEHVQHVSMSAIQEFNTLLSQNGDFHFNFPSAHHSLSRDGDVESVGLEPEASDWLNQSLAGSEFSEASSEPFSTMRTFTSESSELHNTQSSGLSSERSQSSSTNVSESEGELLHWKKGNILGRGAFGVVYCGLTNTGQLIAVKQVQLGDKDDKHKSRQQYEKLQEEVELLKTLRHRNIVGFLGVSLEGNTVNIFMQYIPGGSIASLLARFGSLEEPVFCRYTKQILQGTEYLHAKNVIHRDIKGANIMLMSNGVIKLIDFGCAKRLCINISQSQNLLKSMRGTPYWMAPEVIMETGHGKKSDMWSIGCTVFEMAIRKPPWSEMPPMAAIFAIGSGGPIPQLPERFSPQAREFVNACLTRDQNERPTATQLLTHSFIRKRRERGRDRFETRISSSTLEDAKITFKEHPANSEDDKREREMKSRRRDHFC